jgi:hypothetical protein
MQINTGRWGLRMPEFRYFCLHDNGSIALGRHVEVTDLAEAIGVARENCRTHPAGPLHWIEVWSGDVRLYESPGAPLTAREAD